MSPLSQRTIRRLSVREKKIRNKYLFIGTTAGMILVASLYLIGDFRARSLAREVQLLRNSEARLKSEVFQLECVLNRYETTLEYFRNMDSSYAARFEDYMRDHTE
jgi:hypothetical protein